MYETLGIGHVSNSYTQLVVLGEILGVRERVEYLDSGAVRFGYPMFLWYTSRTPESAATQQSQAIFVISDCTRKT